jgi:hypothetical protein
MINECNKDMTHEEIKKFLVYLLGLARIKTKTEARLQNGKIADIFYVDKAGEHIIEVKSRIKTTDMEEALKKYREMCDYLTIAHPPSPLHAVPGDWHPAWSTPAARLLGRIEVDWAGLRIIRHPARLRPLIK